VLACPSNGRRPIRYVVACGSKVRWRWTTGGRDIPPNVAPRCAPGWNRPATPSHSDQLGNSSMIWWPSSASHSVSAKLIASAPPSACAASVPKNDHYVIRVRGRCSTPHIPAVLPWRPQVLSGRLHRELRDDGECQTYHARGRAAHVFWRTSAHSTHDIPIDEKRTGALADRVKLPSFALAWCGLLVGLLPLHRLHATQFIGSVRSSAPQHYYRAR
jgi:hypothetical protein